MYGLLDKGVRAEASRLQYISSFPLANKISSPSGVPPSH